MQRRAVGLAALAGLVEGALGHEALRAARGVRATLQVGLGPRAPLEGYHPWWMVLLAVVLGLATALGVFALLQRRRRLPGAALVGLAVAIGVEVLLASCSAALPSSFAFSSTGGGRVPVPYPTGWAFGREPASWGLPVAVVVVVAVLAIGVIAGARQERAGRQQP